MMASPTPGVAVTSASHTGASAPARGAPAPVGGANDHDVAPVDLLREHALAQVEAQRGRGPAPVLDHGGGIVAHVQPEVQAGIGARRHPAVPGGDQGVQLQVVERWPRQHVQAGAPAEGGGGGHGRRHGTRQRTARLPRAGRAPTSPGEDPGLRSVRLAVQGVAGMGRRLAVLCGLVVALLAVAGADPAAAEVPSLTVTPRQHPRR